MSLFCSLGFHKWRTRSRLGVVGGWAVTCECQRPTCRRRETFYYRNK